MGSSQQKHQGKLLLYILQKDLGWKWKCLNDTAGDSFFILVSHSNHDNFRQIQLSWYQAAFRGFYIVRLNRKHEQNIRFQIQLLY